jgi:alkylhydroperoxidase family enzyme
MTPVIALPDAVFEDVRRHFDDSALVELTVLIASYNMNARVLKALAVDLEPGA